MPKRYILHIDESGVANLCEYQSKFFILAGLIIEETTEKELTTYFNYIKKKYGLPLDKNFHAVGLFEKRKSNFYLSNVKCKNFCKSVAEFIDIYPFEIRMVCLDKALLRGLLSMPAGYGFRGDRDHREDKDIGYEILARKIFLEFAQFLKRENGQGCIIAESRRGADYRLLKTFLASQEQNQFKTKRLKDYSRELEHRIYSISFENKKGLSGGLELADLISYLGNQKVNRKLTALEDRGSKVLWKSIEKKAKLNLLSRTLFNKFAEDRIRKTANVIKRRLIANSDLVNPTFR